MSDAATQAADRVWREESTRAIQDAFRAENAEAAARSSAAPSPANDNATTTQPETPKPEPAATKPGSSVAERKAMRDAQRQADQARAKPRVDSSVEQRRLGREVHALRTENAQYAQQIRAVQANADRINRGLAAIAAIENADHDAAAKALGFDNWRAVDEHLIQSVTDPGYKRTRELAGKLAAIEGRERQQAERAQAVAAEQSRQQHVNAYRQQLSAEMAKSTDPLVRVSHDNPIALARILEIQRSHWDGRTPLDPAKCLDVPLAGGSTLRQQLEELIAFGDKLRAARTPAVEPTAPKAARTSTERSGARGQNDDRAWTERAAKELSAAFEAEGRKR